MSSNHKITYTDTPELERARSAFINGEHTKALRIFEKAAKKQPYNIMALTDAARAHGQRFEVEFAERCVKRMLKLAQQSGNRQINFMAGQTLRMIYRSDEALEQFMLAEKSSSVHHDVYLELAVLMERRHKLVEANGFIDHFLAQEKSNPEAHLLKARILRRQGLIDDARNIYLYLEKSNCSRGTKAQTINELSLLLDSEGNYQEAFAQLVKSKAILQQLPESKNAIFNSQNEQKWLKCLNDSVSERHMSAWMNENRDLKLRSVLLTGCPRSGTTLIEKIIDAHEEVISADEVLVFTDFILPTMLEENRDEKGFFDAQDVENIPSASLDREAKRFLKYLSNAMMEKPNSRYLVDKNPSLTGLIPMYQRLLPQNKILYALRDPRDIALSCFFRWLPVNSVSVRYHTIEDTFKRTAEELGYWEKTKQKMPDNSWFETRYENTVLDYTAESKRVLEWMGLEWSESISNYRNHMDKRGVNSPTYEAVSKPIYKGAIGRWKNYEEYLEPYIHILQPYIDAFGYE